MDLLLAAYLPLVPQTVADGLVLGGIYALAAVGFSLIFGVLHVINLSHGILVLLGAYLALILSQALHIDPLLCIPPVMVVLFCIGYVYQRLLIQRAVDRASVNSMLLTFGVALMLQNVMIWLFSPDMKNITPSYAFNSFKIGPVNFDAVRVSALVASLILLSLLAAFLRYSPMGRVIRATAQQTLAARLCGVNVRHVYALTFAVSAAFAGAAGIVIGIILPFSPNDEGTWTLNAFVVVVLGGVGSPAGALIGGLLLGLVSRFTAQFVGDAYPNIAMFLLLVVLLLVRPQGLLGNAFSASR
jgi:branched-chain amino acid transport system permease protein